MRILLLGSAGQVGWELRRTLAPLGDVVRVDRQQADLTDKDAVRRAVRTAEPALIVNAAAYTAVDRAESEPEVARAVNGEAPGVLAEEARRLGAALVHFSTDYVFDGKKSAPYTEDDPTSPLSAYGASKLEGERAIQAVGGAYVILRTSWVYGMRGQNFLLTMCRLARERPALRIVDDQTGAPTWSRMIAETTALIVARAARSGTSFGDTSGVYHLTAGGATTWFGFAREILRNHGALGIANAPTLDPIPTAEYPTLARRPANSLLDNDKLRHAFGLTLPAWDEGLRMCVEEGARSHRSPTENA
jgi:dTDP-4-dehydrorhamnose reductase